MVINTDWRALGVVIRTSILAAIAASALINKMSRRSVTLGMNGSLYKFHPHFQIVSSLYTLLFINLHVNSGKDDVHDTGSC